MAIRRGLAPSISSRVRGIKHWETQTSNSFCFPMGSSMQERRRRRRSRASHPATIAWGAMSVLDCVVRDFSATGAPLEFLVPAKVPDAFELRLDGEQPA